jgi:hypothetical protein
VVAVNWCSTGGVWFIAGSGWRELASGCKMQLLIPCS